MTQGDCEPRRLAAAGAAIALFAAIAVAPHRARAGGIDAETPPPLPPRFSNHHHHVQGLALNPGCAALPPGAAAAYIPGRNAWGRPVVPAEPQAGPHYRLPDTVELDIIVGNRHRHRDSRALVSVPLTYNLRAESHQRHPAPWDCTLSFK